MENQEICNNGCIRLRASIDREITNADLGLAENHFACTEDNFGPSNTEELEIAIEHCKEAIRATPEKSDAQNNLVRKLVHLRIKLHELKEGPEPLPAEIQLVLGHRFEKRQVDCPQVKRFCEKCNGNIWGVLHTWYQCQQCRVSCHGRCLNSFTRVCASLKVQENPTYLANICPEVGLSSQNYRCAECKVPIMNTPGIGFQENPFRLIFIGSGIKTFTIMWQPNEHGRLISMFGSKTLRLQWPILLPTLSLEQCNYDSCSCLAQLGFRETKGILQVEGLLDILIFTVCRASKQFLHLMKGKAILNIEEHNPMLFNFVEDLCLIKKLRTNIMAMKQYFLSCRMALESKLLLQLSTRQHFVDGPHMYSMQDLEDVESGILIEFLTTIHANFSKHIREDCQVCRGRGHICEVCKSGDILYPFEDDAVTCADCLNLFHKECFYRRDQVCPRCQRFAEKIAISESNL